MTAGKRRVLVALPAKAKDLENALHSACDSGHWEGEVQLVLDRTQHPRLVHRARPRNLFSFRNDDAIIFF